jgi:hypothetical protein
VRSLRVSRLVEKELNIFSRVADSPAVQALLQRAEHGGVLSLGGINGAAQPFVVAFLRRFFPHRTILAVTGGLKAQESFHQDLATWMKKAEGPESSVEDSDGRAPRPFLNSQPLFYPAWDILPHEP